MSRNSDKYNRYRAISKINSKKLRSGNGNQKNNSGRNVRVGNAFVAHGTLVMFITVFVGVAPGLWVSTQDCSCARSVVRVALESGFNCNAIEHRRAARFYQMLMVSIGKFWTIWRI